MSAADTAEEARAPALNPAFWRDTGARYALAICVFFSAFVMREPSPYDLLLPVFMGLFILFGMRLSAVSLLLATLFCLFNFGGLLSMFTMDEYKNIPLYLAISLFLGLSSVFFCAAIEADWQRLRSIIRGYVLGAVATALLGILGYFNALPGFEVFTLYDRAKGAFKDPNVFGPFLVLPTLYLIYGLLSRPLRNAPYRAAFLLVLLFAIFLSFSRAAWGLVAVSGALTYGLLVATERSALRRMRLILVGLAGVAGLVLLLLVALQFDAVADMVTERAKLVQDYDGAQVGRFARHLIGFQWALSNPLGIGPLEFGLRLGEDTHNIWVKALMAYGWIGFFAYAAVVAITAVGGGVLLGKQRPWQPYLLCSYAAFIGHLMVSWVIDIDHWRHIHLIYGIIWGCMALELRHQRRSKAMLMKERPAYV
ncbi:MAG: O-antigen ligase family protein [Pseudomonadota bacterium]